mgnify:CR=1
MRESLSADCYKRLPLVTIGTVSVLLTCVMVYWDVCVNRR